MSTETRIPIPGDRLRFAGKTTSWLARAATVDGRYLLCTASLFGQTVYTVCDFQNGVRGPLNVIGGGMGIKSLSGPDAAIDKTIAMLEGRAEGGHEGPYGHWHVSYRNRVPLEYMVRPGDPR